MKRGGLLLAFALIGGCWSETLEDGVFSEDQWAKLRDELRPPPPPASCPAGVQRNDQCASFAAFGRTLFFNKTLSQSCVTFDTQSGVCTEMRSGIVSCGSCHDSKNWFIDTRAPNNVSQGELNPTKRNSMSLVNVSLKEEIAPKAEVFTWSGQGYTSAGAVLDLAVRKAMSTTAKDLANTIEHDQALSTGYMAIWGPIPPDVPIVFNNVALAFDAYMRRLVSLNTPFDRYITGDASAIDDAAKRGFAVFVGPAGCIGCHSGPLFSDLEYHGTGVLPLLGVSDAGRGDAGEFLTPPLRHVAKTGPYMHDGVFANLGEVIDFYRRGGDQAGFAKDPRIAPLDITDDEAHDLEAFLDTLTGDPVPVDQTCAVPPCM